MAAVIDRLDDDALIPLLAILGVVVVSGAGVSIHYNEGVRDFMPRPHVARV